MPQTIADRTLLIGCQESNIVGALYAALPKIPELLEVNVQGPPWVEATLGGAGIPPFFFERYTSMLRNQYRKDEKWLVVLAIHDDCLNKTVKIQHVLQNLNDIVRTRIAGVEIFVAAVNIGQMGEVTLLDFKTIDPRILPELPRTNPVTIGEWK